MKHWRCLWIVWLICAAVAASRSFAAEGIPDGAVAAIEKIVGQGLTDKQSASYAVGVMKDGRLVMARGFGYADLENDVPATAETVYRLGSITKQFTSLAIMQLVEAGKLSVDDELTKFLPDYPLQGHKVTVEQLLNHTSGIKSYTDQPDFFKRARQELSRDELLATVKDKPFDFEPGTSWHYNNSGYFLLGVIIQRASGESYADYLREHIFRPLGMSATRYGDTQPIIRHRAQGYRRLLGGLINDEPISMGTPGAAGALVSNVLDLLKWHQALEAGALVGSSSYDALYRPTRLADGKTRPYGYGWGVSEAYGRRKLSHGGGINGFSTMIARYPDDRLAVIVLANTAGTDVGSIETRIAKVMLGIEDKPLVDLPIDETIGAALVGTYALREPLGGAEAPRAEVTREEKQLFIRLPGRERERMKYQGEQGFALSGNGDVRLRFTIAGGKAEGFEMEVMGVKYTAQRVEGS